jgi:hypothetical protein
MRGVSIAEFPGGFIGAQKRPVSLHALDVLVVAVIQCAGAQG